MSSITSHASQSHAVPSIYRLQRLFLAACVVLGLTFPVAVVLIGPGYYSTKSGPVALLDSFITASTVQLQIDTICSVIGTYLFPIALLTMAWLAMRRAPWLASIAALVIIVGVLPFPAFNAQNALSWDLARMGNNPLFDTIVQRFNDDGVMNYYNIAFVLGTIPGLVLLGIALWRARVVPVWVAILVLIGRPLVLFYPLVQSFIPAIYIQLLSWLPLFISSIPIASALLRTPSNDSMLDTHA